MRNIQIILGYDGSRYHGWQRQKNLITVQEEVEKAIIKLTKENNKVNGCSRTDSGVHAKGQSANFFTEKLIPIEKIPLALNTYLPKDIRVYKAVERPIEFHSRYHAKGKRYTYQILNNPYGCALEYKRAWHIPQRLNVEEMVKANEYIIGTHDFSAFRVTGSGVKSSIRTIYKSKLIKDGDKIILDIEGNGFLYKMVRSIIGTLVEVGKGRFNPEDIPKIMESRNRKNGGKTAPPEGLYLEEIYY
ncbi:MAG TPA: tRNA pseudouridine(38-40) synthase TruA [Eubacteriaceae bacterium]|nr:tRNA pseudouridine(38-40) synthase TruA [Eubacteriaceae bacterium]